MRGAAVIGLGMTLCLADSAGPLAVVLQEGLEGYRGTEDFVMYAPSPMAC